MLEDIRQPVTVIGGHEQAIERNIGLAVIGLLVGCRLVIRICWPSSIRSVLLWSPSHPIELDRSFTSGTVLRSTHWRTRNGLAA